MAKTMKDLKARAKEMQVVLPFMDNREKEDLVNLQDKTVTIRDFGFLKDEKGGEYVAFICDEYPKDFFFGGSVLTDDLKTLQDDGYYEAIVKEGLPTKFGEKKSKNNRTYTTNTFYPEG